MPVFFFNSFHTDADADAVNHLNDLFKQLVIPFAAHCLCCEILIHFHIARIHVTDAVEIGISGSKIIDHELNPIFLKHFPEFTKDRCHIHEAAFSHFYADAIRHQSIVPDRSEYLVCNLSMLDLITGNIHVHTEFRYILLYLTAHFCCLI